MNKERLITLIIKKQTYKQTKDIQNQILHQNTDAANTSIQAIKEILQTDYNAQAKLYSIRYLRDCFEKANPFFIERTQYQVLPILVNIIRDSTDQKSIMKYAGSYTKKQQLQKFKSIILSFFLMSKQCVKNWAIWIPDKKKSFLDTFQKLKRQGILFDKQNTYFREQHATLFFQNCKKNKLPYFEQNKGVQYSNQNINSDKQTNTNKNSQKKTQLNNNINKKVSSPAIKQVVFESKMNAFKNRDPKIDRVLTQAKVLFQKDKINQKQINNVQNKFNEALDHYCQTSPDLDQAYIEQCMGQFQAIKQILIKKSKGELIKVVSSKIKQEKPIQFSSNIIQSKIKENQVSINKKQPGYNSISENSGTFGFKNNQQQKQIFDKESSISTIKKQYNEQISNASPLKMLTDKLKSNNTQSKSNQQPVNFTNSQNSNFKKSKDSQLKSKQEENKKLHDEQSLAKQISFANQTAGFETKKQKLKQKSIQPSRNTNQRVNFEQNSVWTQSQKQDEDRYQQNEYHYKVNPPPEFPKPKTKKEEDKYQSSMKKIKYPIAAPIPIQQKSIQEDSRKIQSQRSNNIKQNTNRNNLKQVVYTNNNEINSLKQQISHLKTDYQMMQQNNIMLQRQIFKLKQQQKTMLQRLRHTVPVEQLSKLKKQLYQQRRQKSLLQQKINQFQQQINRLNKLIQQLEYHPKYDKIQSQQKFQLAVPRNLQSKNVINNLPSSTSRTNLNTKIITQKISQDYIQNKTHYTKINNWLTNQNTLLFKKSILGMSHTFYQDKGVSISQQQFLTIQKSQVFLNINFRFSSKFFSAETPKVKYQNIQQIDLWKKPLKINNDYYQQQLVAKKCGNPLKIMKGHVQLRQHQNCTFLLPFLYFNYTVSQDFKLDQFLNIFSVKHEQVIKSMIFQLDSSIIGQLNDFKKIFKNVIIDGKSVNFCLSQLGKQNVFMCQIQILKNQKAVLRILPIPNHNEMNEKASQLQSNLIFLLSI